MIWRFFKGDKEEASPARVPEGIRVYAIGDIHGRIDLLRRLHRTILDDAASRGQASRNLIVCLGDYVDRGHDSRDVIEFLLAPPPPGFQVVCLKGNHEQLFLDFLDDPAIGPSWFDLGGNATLYSYGARTSQDLPRDKRWIQLHDDFKAALPATHLEFLLTLDLSFELGDYLFVHAGVRPGRSLAQQEPQDLLWIRDAFTNSRVNHGKVVVHGHSISFQPEIFENRIGIDTGA